MIKCTQKTTFLYFSYGENLLTLRIHMHSPSAKFISIGRLDNYRGHFINYSSFWGGPLATLVPTANAHVWGVIWQLNNDDKLSLETLKGENNFYAKYLDVLTPHVGVLRCRVYIQITNPMPRGDNDIIPVEQWPSRMYKNVMILGATEHNLPECYIAELEKIADNGEDGCFKMHWLLNRYALELPCQCLVPGRIARKSLQLDLNILKRKNKQ
ncbi:hypothetical protein ACJJTC_012726 [Scirpophaga incertulas]